MRLIGTIKDEAEARRFCDALLVRGIANEREQSADASWTIWVLDEEQVGEGRFWLERFILDPDSDEFAGASAEAERIRNEERREASRLARLNRPVRNLARAPRVTLILMVLCVLVALLSRMGQNRESLYGLLISLYPAPPLSDWARALPEVRQGQVWRLFTPILIHFGPLHLIFNLLWFHDLGGSLERMQGSLRFLVKVLAIAALSNVAQYFVSGPLFGGMSGVVYGLLGYIGVRGRVDPGFSLRLHGSTLLMMGLWLVLGLIGVMGPMANTVHLVGLGLGAAWGWTAGRGLGRRH